MAARPSPQHDELPLANYDQLPLHSLQHRIRSLEPDEVETLLAYEREHADRRPVIRVLDARLVQLRSDGTPPPPARHTSTG